MIPGQGAALAAVAVTAVLWGTAGTAATFSEGVSPLATGAAALGFGGILQALVALGPVSDRREILRAHPWLVTSGAVGVFVYPLAFYSSMHLAGVAVGTVVSLASAPLFAGLLEWLVSRRPPSARWFVAAVTGVVGAVLICTGQSGNADSATAPDLVAGVLLGLAAGASYALYSWAAARRIVAGAGRAAAMGGRRRWARSSGPADYSLSRCWSSRAGRSSTAPGTSLSPPTWRWSRCSSVTCSTGWG